jgi:hypothetical protein
MLVAIIRVYDHHTDAADAVQGLRKAGVPERDISVLSRDDRVTGAAKGAEIGAVLGGFAGLLTGLGLVAIPGIGPVTATGWLAATAAGAAAGGLAGGSSWGARGSNFYCDVGHTRSSCITP